MLLKWVILLPLSLAAICPLERHQVCNVIEKDKEVSEQNKHRCTCAITPLSDRPAPEQSCTNLITPDEEDGTFPVVSLTFNLKESPELDEFPEDSFRDTIAGALRVNQVDIVLLRVNCMGTEDTLTVQFGVLKNLSAADVKKKKKDDNDVDDDDNDNNGEDDNDEDKDDDDDGHNDNDGDGDDDDDDHEKYGKKKNRKVAKKGKTRKGDDDDDNDGNYYDDGDDDDDEDNDKDDGKNVGKDDDKYDDNDDDKDDNEDGDKDDDKNLDNDEGGEANDDDDDEERSKGKIKDTDDYEDGGDEDDDDDEDEEEDEDEEVVKDKRYYESIRYEADQFVDAESVAIRMKAMGHLNQIADLQVDSIAFTEDIIELEYKPDNSTLFIQTVVAGGTMLLMLIIGTWVMCRKREYSDDLQRA